MTDHRLGSGFLNDGRSRVRAASEPEIRDRVIVEYSEQLDAAGFWGRLWLRRKIAREVKNRLKKAASPESLY